MSFPSSGPLVVHLSPESVAALADALAVRMGAPPAELPDSALPDALTPRQAMRFTGRCRTAVFNFMRHNPAACVTDDAGLRRVRLNWLRAWCAGGERLRALQRAAGAAPPP